MPAHKTFFNRTVTAVSVESDEKEIALSLGIRLSDALRLGLNFMIKDRIIEGDRRVTSEILEQFKTIETRDLQDLERYIRLKNAEQTTLEKLLESKKEAEKDDEIIEVWDRSVDEYIRIRRSQFDPEWQTIKNRPGGSRS